MRLNWLRLMLLVLVASFASGSGCDSNDGGGVVLPPLRIRSTFPVDEANLFEIGQDSLTISLAVTFVRGSQPGDVQFRLFPTPLSSGLVTLTSTGRTWSWESVEMSATPGAYYWLIDGADIPVPKVVRLITGMVDVIVGFQGTITSLDGTTLPLDGCMLFAIPSRLGFNPFEPESFDVSDAVAIASVDSLGAAGSRDYHMSYMLMDSVYNAVAILDTNNDAEYDLVNDAWGYLARDADTSPQPIVVDIQPILGRDDPDNRYRSDIDITIAPPAVMKEKLASLRR